MPQIPVTGNSPYTVFIDTDVRAQFQEFCANTGARRALIVTQPTVAAGAKELAQLLMQAGLEVELFAVPDAEAAKDISIVAKAWEKCSLLGLDRQDIIVGFGGGAVTDVAGFIAATWMRGIRVIQVPTTILAMVDAAVGGKTGINTPAGKNLVGSFHEPAAVFIDLRYVETLALSERIAGSAEIVKTGFIADPEILARYEHDPAACLEVDGSLPELVARSVAVKARVVSEDLKESHLREILNYGHTFGHAVEHRENYQWRHGNAVAVGMMFIATLATNRGIMSSELLQRHRDILTSIGLPTSYTPSGQPHNVFGELYEAMLHDKKNRGGNIRFVAISEVGETLRVSDANKDELFDVYKEITAS
ncbi:MAG: 3-dehydroquinate synthase [Corynebacterium sp.]|nr:3-dehydroquinate synthase [Corynebacterium sp.]